MDVISREWPMVRSSKLLHRRISVLWIIETRYATSKISTIVHQNITP
jgi:hypothetical protein